MHTWQACLLAEIRAGPSAVSHRGYCASMFLMSTTPDINFMKFAGTFAAVDSESFQAKTSSPYLPVINLEENWFSHSLKAESRALRVDQCSVSFNLFTHF